MAVQFWTLIGVFVGLAGKYISDLLLARKNKLREEKLRWAVEFLTSATQLAQTSESRSRWQLSWRNALAAPDEPIEEDRAKALKQSEEAQDAVRNSWAEAYRANSAVRLLMPTLAKDAARYLELCGRAACPDDERDERLKSRGALEEALLKEVGK